MTTKPVGDGDVDDLVTRNGNQLSFWSRDTGFEYRLPPFRSEQDAIDAFNLIEEVMTSWIGEKEPDTHTMPGYEWTGQWKIIEDTSYWCPTLQKWVWCPGPCDDGTPHGPPYTRLVRGRVMQPVEGEANE